MKATIIRCIAINLLLAFFSIASDMPAKIDYLTDQPSRIISNQQDWGELGINTATHDTSEVGLPLQIKDKKYTKGLGHHANGSIDIRLEGLYEFFDAEIGVQNLSSIQNIPSAGSVAFQVFVDEEEKFKSDVMHDGDEAKPIHIDVAGAEQLRLVVTDGGDGIDSDMANWAEARLIRSTNPSKSQADQPQVDIAPFGRVLTWDASRLDGARANNAEEFHAEDLFLESEINTDAHGNYTVLKNKDSLGCIGLQWLERRSFKKLGIQFADSASMPSKAGVRVEIWTIQEVGDEAGASWGIELSGESPWQGAWKPVQGEIEQKNNEWIFHMDWKQIPEARKVARKIRWVFPAQQKPIIIRQLTAISDARWDSQSIRLEWADPARESNVKIEAYNGSVKLSDDSAWIHDCEWKTAHPLELKTLHVRPSSSSAERTVLRICGSKDLYSIAIDDVLTHGSVYIREAGIFISSDAAKLTLEQYRKSIAGRKTILQQVREKPDQTLAQALAAIHLPICDDGPMMLSLACDNYKFVVDRDGRIVFGLTATEIVYLPGLLGLGSDANIIHPVKMIPKFGSGKNEGLTRHLKEGWLPIPVTTVKEEGVIYQHRSFVAPYDKDYQFKPPFGMSKYPLGIVELTAENSSHKQAKVDFALTWLANVTEDQWTPVELQKTSGGVLAVQGKKLLAYIEINQTDPLQANVNQNTITLGGYLPIGGNIRYVVYLPGWEVEKSQYGQFKAGEKLLTRAEVYWRDALKDAMQIELPDPLLTNIIRASQVHTLIAGRNEEDGARISPWIAAMAYGALDSESNPTIHGMNVMGHHEFARRSLDFFIKRYHPEGYLTTGYTMYGTGLNMRVLGEHYQLTKNLEWLKKIAPQLNQTCLWVTKQLQKTKKLQNGKKPPEYGLIPPGSMADWRNDAYYFWLEGAYYSGLKAVAEALTDVSGESAASYSKTAAEFRENILRAYHATQSQMPVVPLRDGTWIPGTPSQVHCPGPTPIFFPSKPSYASGCYDIELGGHHLAAHDVLDANSPEVGLILDQMEDTQLLTAGWEYVYTEKTMEKDPYNLGGFSKVQPYLACHPNIYAMRDDIKPFIRSYFNSVSSVLNMETFSLWEVPGGMEVPDGIERYDRAHNSAYDDGIGYFLNQTRVMMVMERGNELWLAPLITNQWLQEGMTVKVSNAPTKFGPVSYALKSSVSKGLIEAEIDSPQRKTPSEIVLRLRHPEEKKIRSVLVNGKPYSEFDPSRDCIKLKGFNKKITVKAEY